MSETPKGEGQERPKIEWEPDVPMLHRKLVESGLFDVIPQEEEYRTGDAVLSRYSDKIYQIYEQEGDNLTVGFDTEEEQARKTFPKGDVRGINGYAQKIYQMAEPTTEIQIDKKGHALIKCQIPKGPKPPFPGNSGFSSN